jgi:hypothetical protein
MIYINALLNASHNAVESGPIIYLPHFDLNETRTEPRDSPHLLPTSFAVDVQRAIKVCFR